MDLDEVLPWIGQGVKSGGTSEKAADRIRTDDLLHGKQTL
jgi:hypothetical protein